MLAVNNQRKWKANRMETLYVVSSVYPDEQPIVCAIFKTDEEAWAYVEWRQDNWQPEVSFVVDPAPLITTKGE